MLNCPKFCAFLPFSNCHKPSSTFYSACHNTWISHCCTTIHLSCFGRILLISRGYSVSRLLTLKACFCVIMVTVCCRVWVNSRVIPLPCLLIYRVMSNTKTHSSSGRIFLMRAMITMMTCATSLVLALMTALTMCKIAQVY